ncbi:hypothetical protein V1509DRAFT_193490 [Lipomyces kononenkoae]
MRPCCSSHSNLGVLGLGRSGHPANWLREENEKTLFLSPEFCPEICSSIRSLRAIMGAPIIAHKSSRRRLFDDEIMAKIALRASDVAFRPKRRSFNFRVRIVLVLLLIVLVAQISLRYVLLNSNASPSMLIERMVESAQPVQA